MTEELKSQLDYFKDEPKYLRKVIDELEQENKKLLEARNHFMGVNLKYFNALEEIREIAKFNLFYNPDCFSINGDIGQIQNLKMTEIYHRIIEVLNN